MQATVHRYDPGTRSGEVLADTGEVHPFGPEALAGSGLRHLRPGQRLTVQQAEDGIVLALRLGTVGAVPTPEP